MKLFNWITAIIGLLIMSGVAEAKTVRASDMTQSDWTKFSRPAALLEEPMIVEFRQGDHIPVAMTSEGGRRRQRSHDDVQSLP